MTAPSTPDPEPGPDDQPSTLSARERALLAGIESDLTRADPALARKLARRLPATAARDWSPISAGQLGWLLAALVILILTAVLLPPSWWALLAVITVVLVVPWMLLCTSERTGHRRRRPIGRRTGRA